MQMAKYVIFIIISFFQISLNLKKLTKKYLCLFMCVQVCVCECVWGGQR